MQIRLLVLVVVMLAVWAWPARAQPTCRASEPTVSVKLPARPYAAIASADGCRIFVSTQNTPGPGGLSLVTFQDGKFSVAQSIPLNVQPAGLALSRDGKLLVAPGADGIAFVDTEKFVVLATLSDGSKGPIMAKITSNDKTLFVSDEFSNTITVIDLARARSTGFTADSIVTKIATGIQPLALAISPDQRFLYAAVEIGKTGEAVCRDGARAGAAQGPPFPEGTLTIIDIASKAIVSELPAGCRPIRVVLSSDGKRAFVSARSSNAIYGFDTEKRVALGSVKLPAASFGLVLSEKRNALLATTGAVLSEMDFRQFPKDATERMPTSGSARELTLANDGNTLLLTNGAAMTLDIIALATP